MLWPTASNAAKGQCQPGFAGRIKKYQKVRYPCVASSVSKALDLGAYVDMPDRWLPGVILPEAW